MRTLRLISTTAAIMLLGACAVSAQGIKTDQTPSASAVQQNAPPEQTAPAKKSDQINASENAGQAAPTAPQSDTKQQTTDKGAPASVAAKSSSDTDGSTAVKSKRVEHHVGGRYAGRYHGPLYDTYRGDRGYRDCRHHHHSLMPWLWC